MKKSFCIILLVSILAFLSCERDARNITLPAFDLKLVITSFISPADTISYIRVSTNTRIYGDLNANDGPGNLRGWISDGEKEVELTNLGEGFSFRDEDMKVEEGKTYHLLITSDKGLRAEADCTVPLKRNFSTEIDTAGRLVFLPYSPYPGYRLDFNFFLTDYPGESNYFRLYGKELIYDKGFSSYPRKQRIYGNENEFFSDEGMDGSRFYADKLFTYKKLTADSTIIVFYLLSTDKAYFDYQMSVDQYSGGDVPFTEMSPVYSNIKGGLGIFASYNLDSIVMRYQ